MSETTTTSRGGLLGFFSTLPGILTAIAGLVSAVGTIYITSQAGDDAPDLSGAGPSAPPPAQVFFIDPDDADEAVAETDPQDEVTQLLDACAAGDHLSCEVVLNGLVDECYEGNLASCDVLYLVSEVGSDLEWYGATCGGRVAEEYAGTCEFL